VIRKVSISQWPLRLPVPNAVILGWSTSEPNCAWDRSSDGRAELLCPYPHQPVWLFQSVCGATGLLGSWPTAELGSLGANVT
jgi:hypothetical protein